MIEDPHYNSHHVHEDVFSPCFDVRESDTAFFLEGEFPGVVRKEDITIEKLGTRTLLVEANVTRFNVEAEWGQSAVVPLKTAQDEKLAQQQSRGTSYEEPTGEPGEERTNRQKGKEDGLHVKLGERHAGYLQRSFTFPCAVDIDALKARLRSGLLVLMVPKMRDAKNDSKKIDIED